MDHDPRARGERLGARWALEVASNDELRTVMKISHAQRQRFSDLCEKLPSLRAFRFAALKEADASRHRLRRYADYWAFLGGIILGAQRAVRERQEAAR